MPLANKTVRRAAYLISLVGVGAGLLRLFFATPLWTCVLIALAAAPLIGSLLFPQALETRMRGGGKPRFNPIFGFPVLFAFLVSGQVQFEDRSPALIAAAIAAAALLILGSTTVARSASSPTWMRVLTTILGSGLVFASVLMIDVDLDRSTPQPLRLQVLDKSIHYGRALKGYHLNVPAFGRRKGESSITVSRPDYNALNRGDFVCVLAHKGALGLPWFTARAC